MASREPRRQRRDKYIARACQACRYRKIKCSGHDTCLNCVDRGTECIYIAERRKRGQKAAKRRSDGTRSDGANSQTGGQAACSRTAQTPPEWRRMSPAQEGMGMGMGIESDPQTLKDTDSRDGGHSYPLQVPSLSDRLQLIRGFFNCFHPEYPFLDQQDIERRLSQALAQLECPSGHPPSTFVAVDVGTSSLMALVWAIFSLGQSMSPAVRNNEPNRPPGYAMFDVSRKILQAFEPQPPSFETVACHVLHSMYALHADMVDVSLQSHSVAARLLTVIGSEACRKTGHNSGQEDKARLWWTVFILDRTLSRVTDTPCVLRIDQLPTKLRGILEEGPSWSRQTCGQRPLDLSNDETIHTAILESSYLETMGWLSHLWSSGFNGGAAASGGGCHLRQSALLDTELHVFETALPTTLRWQMPENLPHVEGLGGSTSDECRRLIISTTTNILRLRLRQISPDACSCFAKTRSDGLGIANTTIQGISVSRRSCQKSGPAPSNFTITTALFHSIFCLLSFLDDEGPDDEEHQNVSETVEEGYGILMDLASTCRYAKSAISTLDSTLFSQEEEEEDPGSGQNVGGSMSPEAHVRPLSRESDLSPSGGNGAAAPGIQIQPTAAGGGNLLDELQAGYGDLDTVSPRRMHDESWMATLSPFSGLSRRGGDVFNQGLK